MKRSICYAYFIEGKFVGWYADSFGSVRPQSPKLYSNMEAQNPVILANLKYKLNKINTSSFDQAKEKITNVLQAIGLAGYDSEELLRGREVVLKIVESPIYDGPNPDFDKEAYRAAHLEHYKKMKEEGILNLPGGPKERVAAIEEFNTRNPRPKADNWIYADYSKVKEWAATEPTVFLGEINPQKDEAILY